MGKDTDNMPVWINPFQQYDRRDFPDVLIPLSEALHDSQEPLGAPTPNGIRSAKNGHGNTLPTDTNILTFEALRAEVENDLVVSGHNTVYDRKFTLQLYQGPPDCIQMDHKST